MNSERFKKVEEVYQAVLEVVPQKRDSFLQKVCGSDDELRREVESLLSFDTGTEGDLIGVSPESLAAEMISGQEKNFAAGRRIGRYKILSLLGEGGMGAVYLAEDTKLLRRVALKILLPEMIRDENRVHRFIHEARSASALNHPNILTIYEIDEVRPAGSAEKIHYIAMEYVDGDTLQHLIYRKKPALKTLLEYLAQTADGLAKAHDVGIIHRDLKPENIMVSGDGFAKVLDFGLAKLAEADKTGLGAFRQHRSKSGIILGTLGYMSPEQAQGKQEIGRPSDIFSFGCILYEAATGRQPFWAESTVDALHQIIHSEPAPLAESGQQIPAGLIELIDACLRKKPAERIDDFRSVGESLRRVIAGLDSAGTGIPALGEQKTAIFEDRAATRTISRSFSEQRRQTTVLFADFSVLTELFEDTDPEEAGGIISDLWPRLEKIIVEGGGRIDRRLSDVFTGVWGAEAIHEDDPERAIRAALRLQEEVSSYFSKNLSGRFEDLEQTGDDPPLLLKIGISTGMILLGLSRDSGEFLTTGTAVSTAKRLRQNAPVGGILISHETYRHVRGVFDVEPFAVNKTSRLRNKKKDLKVYLVRRAKPRAFRLRGRDVEGIETRLVGRRGELDRMLDALYTVLEDGEMEVLTVVGEAGLGKSRLLFEFRDRVELLPERIRVFNARAAEVSEGTPFSLLRDVFSHRFEIQDSDSRRVAAGKLTEGLTQLTSGTAGEFGRGGEAEMKAHFIGQVIGFDFSDSDHIRNLVDEPQQIRERALHYAAQFFRTAAAEFPIVIYLDDLHWADDKSLEFFENLTKTCADSAILLLNFTRPLLFDRKPHWGEGEENHDRIELRPLTKRESRRLVGDILQKMTELPEELRDLIVSGAEGNPFYVEELIKMLIDRGAIVKGADEWRTNKGLLGTISVPPTLNGVLQARLDRLSEWEKIILQRASVIGREFWDAAVESFGAERNVRAILESLRRKELIFRHETSVFSGAVEYIFKHALLRDVTYDTVLLRDRQRLHAQTAQWLIGVSGERESENAATIAEHFEKARETARAAVWFGRAGDQARRTHAPEVAASYYQKALRFLESADLDLEQSERLAQTIDWNRGLGEVLQVRAQFNKSIKAYRAMLGAAEEIDDALAKAGAHYGLTIAQFEQGDYRTALESAHQATLQAERAGSSAEAENTLALCLFREARASAGLGNFEKSIELSNRALEITAELGDIGVNARSKNLHMLCVANFALGRFKRAIEFQEQGLVLMREAGNQQNIAYALNALGVVYHARGEPARAIGYFEESLDIMNRIGNRSAQIMIINNIGGSRTALGEHRTAESDLRRVFEMAGNDDHFILSETYHFLAQALLGQNRPQEALEAARRSLRIAEESGNTEIIGVAWRVVGMIVSRLGEEAGRIEIGGEKLRATDCFEKSLRIFTEKKMEAERAYTLKAQAQHEHDRGDVNRARKLLSRAGEIFERLEMSIPAEFSGSKSKRAD